MTLPPVLRAMARCSTVLAVAIGAVACGSSPRLPSPTTRAATELPATSVSTAPPASAGPAVAGGAVEGTSPTTTAPLTGEALAFASRVEAATTCDELKQISGEIAVANRDTGFNPDVVSLTLNERREALGCIPTLTLDPADPEGTSAAIGALTDCLQILAVEQEALDRARDGLNRGDTAAVDLYYSFTTAAGARFEARCGQG